MNNDFVRSTIETGGLPGYTWYPHVGSVRVDGPYNESGISSTPSREKIYSCHSEGPGQCRACALEIIDNLSELAFRGYNQPEDRDKLLQFFNQGLSNNNSFDEGIALVIQRILSDPKFIYRIDKEPQDLQPGDVYAITDLDLASRLSFFLWSSIPDKALIELAKSGQLKKAEVLDQQVRRMLQDPRSEAFTRNFAGQWQALRNLDAHEPVTDQFPDFDNLLRQSQRREVELLLDSIIRDNCPITDILTADYTFVNKRLAMHYGIPGIKGERFRRVELDGDLAIRAGILGKSSSLTVPSQPGRTSPVKRCYWVLASILGVEPPPPPPNVKIVPPKQAGSGGDNANVPSMREWMEGHRTNPACAGCHRMMNPIGFALESFDAIGRFREEENAKPIPTAADLTSFLLNYHESVVRNVTQKMLTYAVGRGMEVEDMPLVRKVQDIARKDDYRFQTLITAVVNSEAFLNNEVAGADESAVALK